MNANKDKSICDLNEFRRTHYFHGMLLDDKDFRNEQNYHLGKRRFLNRMLHGSGIVCGLKATGENEKITITPGFALDCCGNEIWVDHQLEMGILDLWPIPPKSNGKNPCDEKAADIPKDYHLVIRYQEKEVDPVPVYLPGAGCDEKTCEHSRTREGFCLELIEGKDCPQYESPRQACSPPGDCPECHQCDKPCYVILGSLTLNSEGHVVGNGPAIREDCRKYIITGWLIRQMIMSTFTETDASGNSIGLSIPGSDKKTKDPVEALCSLFNYLKNLRQGVSELKAFQTDITNKTVLLKDFEKFKQSTEESIAALTSKKK